MQQLPAAGFLDIAMVLFDRRKRYRVEGDSMLPLISEGDQLVVDEHAEISVGDIVIARHPFIANSEMVKRIERIDPSGNCFLIGDNADASTDSRTFGPVSIHLIRGKVVSRLAF